MRHIIHEQAYEKPVAAGQYQYRLNGEPTGAVELWRLTSAPEGYQFLRVDLDARAAPSGHTYLYHGLLGPDGFVERLKYRFWGMADGERLQVTGDLVFEDTAVSTSRIVNGQPFDQVLALPERYGFWFPSVAGLHFAGKRLWGSLTGTAVTLNGQIGGPETLAAQVVAYHHMPLITDFLPLDVAGKPYRYAPWQVRWGDNIRVVWREGETTGWPLGMERMLADGGVLTAVATRFVTYR